MADVMPFNAYNKQAQVCLPLDGTLDKFLREFARALTDEAKSGQKPREIESYVEQYGLESPGFLNYSEFKDIYVSHVLPLQKNKEIEEQKLFALFGVFDGQSRGKIARRDFVLTVDKARPPNQIMERIICKIRKGGERLERALRDELLEADAPFGCNSQLPINIF